MERNLTLVNKSEVKKELDNFAKRLCDIKGCKVENCEMAGKLYTLAAALWGLAENLDDGRPAPHLVDIRASQSAQMIRNFNANMRRR